MNSTSLPGIVRATLNVTELARCLSGETSWEDTFLQARRGTCKGILLNRLAAGKLIALVPGTIHAREVICTLTPAKDGMAACFSLKCEHGEWRVNPQTLMGDCFEQHALIEIERTEWLNAGCILVLGLQSSKRIWNPDLVMWEIVSTWPSWQREGLTWPQRAKDLAARSGTNALSAHTLFRKCQRVGLVK